MADASFVWFCLRTETDFNRRIVLVGQVETGLDVVELKFVGDQRLNLDHPLDHGTQGLGAPYIALLLGVVHEAGIDKFHPVVMPAADIQRDRLRDPAVEHELAVVFEHFRRRVEGIRGSGRLNDDVRADTAGPLLSYTFPLYTYFLFYGIPLLQKRCDSVSGILKTQITWKAHRRQVSTAPIKPETVEAPPTAPKRTTVFIKAKVLSTYTQTCAGRMNPVWAALLGLDTGTLEYKPYFDLVKRAERDIKAGEPLGTDHDLKLKAMIVPATRRAPASAVPGHMITGNVAVRDILEFRQIIEWLLKFFEAQPICQGAFIIRCYIFSFD